MSDESVPKHKPKGRWASCYVLMSEDAREMALISMAQAPQSIRDFVEVIERWLSVMRAQADHVDTLRDSDTPSEGGGLQ